MDTKPGDAGTGDTAEARLSVLLQIGRALGSSLELPVVLQMAIDSAVRLLGFDTGAIYLVTGDSLFLGATVPALPPHFPDELRCASLADHPHVRRSLDDRYPVVVRDAQREPMTAEEQQIVDARCLRTILYVPLVVDESPVGIFIIGSCDRVIEVGDDDIELCTTLSYTIALAVANARLFESIRNVNREMEQAYHDATEARNELRALASQLSIAQERERLEIACEVHDRILQPLAVLKMKLMQARERFAGHGGDDTFTSGIELLEEALREARNIMSEESADNILDLGVESAIQWLCEQTGSDTVSCTCELDPALDDLPQELAIFSFQAVRELLSNVVKHAGPCSVSVTTHCDTRGVTVRVTDDGAGFRSEQLAHDGDALPGFGLFSLRERALHNGGTLEIASAPGVGTTAVLRFPVATPASSTATHTHE